MSDSKFYALIIGAVLMTAFICTAVVEISKAL